MPRNVVTVEPRFAAFLLPGRRKQIEAELAERHRYRRRGDAMEIDFPKRLGREAREQVIAELDEIDPRWRRLFRLYPR
jgi:hypothetical protein